VVKILVVDDDAHMRELLTQELEDAGYQVVVAATGEEALEKVRSDHPDLVILDLVMPILAGTEALPQIIELDQQIPVIINTGYGSFRDDFITWAAKAYVVKSGDTEELKARVREALADRAATPPVAPDPKAPGENAEKSAQA